MHRYKLLSFYLESRFFLEAHIIYKNEQDRKHFLIKYMSFDLNEIKLAGNFTYYICSETNKQKIFIHKIMILIHI